MNDVSQSEIKSIVNCISDAPITISEVNSMYPSIPAEEEIVAIILSNVLSRIVIHFTNAKEVNENTKVMHAAAATDGANIGHHRFLNRAKIFLPFGNNRNCSSSAGFSVERTGSQNRMTNAMLNHA